MNRSVIRMHKNSSVIAAKWEVDTARIQQDAGDPNAGLSEAERAARMGLGATYDPVTKKPVGQFRAVALDLDGDGQISTAAKEAAGNDVAFDRDDSGYLKQVAWINSRDGFLVLDRGFNSSVDNGTELLSNPLVTDAAKGLRSLSAFDANGDGRMHYGYESALRSVDVRYGSIAIQTLEAPDKGVQYQALQGRPIGIANNYQKHSCLRNPIGRYRVKKHSKPCANESVWRHAA